MSVLDWRRDRRPPRRRVAATAAERRRLLGNRLHERHNAHDPHHAFQVVGEHVQAHLGTDVLKRAGQEMRVTPSMT